MQAPSDQQRIGALEKKIDEGFAGLRTQIVESERALRGEIASVRGEVQGVRSEVQGVRGEVYSVRADGRSDFRTLIAVTFGMWVTTILAIIGAMLQHAV